MKVSVDCKYEQKVLKPKLFPKFENAGNLYKLNPFAKPIRYRLLDRKYTHCLRDDSANMRHKITDYTLFAVCISQKLADKRNEETCRKASESFEKEIS